MSTFCSWILLRIPLFLQSFHQELAQMQMGEAVVVVSRDKRGR